MSLVQLKSDFGQGGSGLSDGRLRDALLELQGEKVAVVDGAAADTNIAISGIKVTDTIKSVIMYATGVPSNVTADASITSAGNIRLTSVSTGNKLVVTYLPKP